MIGRLIAFLMIIIPVGLAAIGVKLIRDSLFDIIHPLFPWIWLQFAVGTIFFVIGIGFIGGWIVSRDRKRNYNYKKIRKQQNQDNNKAGNTIK